MFQVFLSNSTGKTGIVQTNFRPFKKILDDENLVFNHISNSLYDIIVFLKPSYKYTWFWYLFKNISLASSVFKYGLTFFRSVIVCVKGSIRSAAAAKKAAGRFHLGRLVWVLSADVFFLLGVRQEIKKNLKNKIFLNQKERKKSREIEAPNISKTWAGWFHGVCPAGDVLFLTWHPASRKNLQK